MMTNRSFKKFHRRNNEKNTLTIHIPKEFVNKKLILLP